MSWKHLVLLLALLPAAAGLRPRPEDEQVLSTRELSEWEEDERAHVVGGSNGRGRQATRRLPFLESTIEYRVKECTSDYLNGLVARSVRATQKQLSNIAFVKTHKTASTTLAYIFFRYARRHQLKLAYFDDHNSAIPLGEAVSQTKGGKGRVDVMHYHHSVFGQYEGTWKQAEEAYRMIMRDPDNIKYVTVVREPRSHLLSYYYYFLQPNTKESIEDFLMRPKHDGDNFHDRLRNPMSAEFGVKTKADMVDFINKYLSHFFLVILTEQFDEGLMLLRRQFGWDMIDVTYHSMLKTTAGQHRYDGKVLMKAPHYDDLPKEVQKRIDSLTSLDQMLYTAAEEHYAKRRESIAEFLPGDLKKFESLQDIASAYLDSNISSKANIMYKTGNVYSDKTSTHDF